MNNDYDPGLQALFTQARQEYDRDAFTSGVLKRMDQERRRALFAWSAFGLAGVAVVALLANPLLTALSMASYPMFAAIPNPALQWMAAWGEVTERRAASGVESSVTRIPPSTPCTQTR